jgi:putative N6-adenine-specific DNA methylase
MDFDAPNKLLVTCGPGLARYLRSEIEALGFRITSFHEGGIGITASFSDAMRLNLELRTAYNVLFLVKEFTAADPDELYRETAAVAWEELIPNDGYVSVVTRVDTPTITHTAYPALKVKDAIVDRIAERTGRRPDSGPQRTRAVVQLFWKDDRAWLYLNTSGVKLSDRGYRRRAAEAPMREALAAGVLMAAGYDGSMPLVNPMCGSGTLAIEAALIATGRAPGLLRGNFGLMHLAFFDAESWRTLRAEVRRERKRAPACPIVASDIDERAVRAARRNAQTAGVDHAIDFYVCDFAETRLPVEPGMVILNPPYGERLGDRTTLETTYRRIGDFFKQRCPGYTGYVFTGNRDLVPVIGLKARRRLPFMNGAIPCHLLEYELYEGSLKRNS